MKALALSLGLSSPIVATQLDAQESIRSLLYCDHGDLDFWSLLQEDEYEVVSGDTLSGIAARNDIPYNDFLLVFQYLYPTKDINSLRIWESFQIPKSDPQSLAQIDQHRSQIQREQSYDTALSLWNENELEILSNQFGYELFPDLPIGIWLEAFHSNLLNEFSSAPRAYWPRVVDQSYQTEVICANLSRSADRYAFWNVSDLTSDVYDWLYTQNVDAWMFTEHYTEVWYTQLLNGREMFRPRMAKWVNPILNSERENYSQYLMDMQRHFRENWVPWSKIPAFFLYTGVSDTINNHRWGSNPNSHVFAYVWEWVKEPFRASEFLPIVNGQTTAFRENISIVDYLVYLTQDISSFNFTRSESYGRRIKSNLEDYAEFIELYINGERIDMVSEFQNPSLEIMSDDMIQFWGSIVFDWLHINNSPDLDLKENMNMRLIPLWSVLAVDWLFPTEVLEPSQEILNYGYEGPYGDIVRKIQIEDVFYLREWDDIQQVIRNLLSEDIFSTSDYDQLDSEQKREIELEYSLQSLAYQMYWYQTNGWSSWNPQATNINAPIYLFDSSNIREVYREYIVRKKWDFFDSLKTQCETGELTTLPFFEMVFFPGDTTASVLYQLNLHMQTHNPELARQLRDLDRIWKDKLLRGVFGEEIASGNIPSWGTELISFSSVVLELEFFSLSWDENFILQWEDGSVSLDSILIDELTTNSTMRYMLSYILANESYIDECVDCNDFYRQFLWPFLDSKRRLAKDTLHSLDTLWFIERGNELLATIDSQAGNINIPRIPGIQSYGDFQLRFANLYGIDYMQSWPGNNLEAIIQAVLDPFGKYNDFIMAELDVNADIVQADIDALLEIQSLLQNETDLSLWKKIAEQLAFILRLNDGTHSNIIGKIVSLELMHAKLQDHFNNASLQVELSGGSLETIDADLIQRFRDTVMLMNNKWETTELRILAHNYILRIFEALDQKHPQSRTMDFPISQRSWGILDKVQFNRGIFINNIVIFQSILAEYPDSQEKEILQAHLQILSDREGSSNGDIYSLAKDSDLNAFLLSSWYDISILPTQEEFEGLNDDWRKEIFWYVNNADSVALRIEQTPTEIISYLPVPIATYLLFLHLLCRNIQTYLDAPTNRALWKKKRRSNYAPSFYKHFLPWNFTIEREDSYTNIKRQKEKQLRKESQIIRNTNIKARREKILETRKENVFLKKINKIIKKTPDTGVDEYVKKKMEGTIPFVITNEWRNEHLGLYRDGYYKITPENGIETWKWFTQAWDYVLSNDPWHPISLDYEDGEYEFISEITKIIRDWVLSKYREDEMSEKTFKMAAE